MFKISNQYHFVLQNILPFNDLLYFCMEVDYSYNIFNFEKNKEKNIINSIPGKYFDFGEFDSPNKDVKEIDGNLYNTLSYEKKISIYPDLLKNKSIGCPLKSLIPMKIDFVSDNPELFNDAFSFVNFFDDVVKYAYLSQQDKDDKKLYIIEHLNIDNIHDFIKIDFVAGFNRYFKEYAMQQNYKKNLW